MKEVRVFVLNGRFRAYQNRVFPDPKPTKTMEKETTNFLDFQNLYEESQLYTKQMT